MTKINGGATLWARQTIDSDIFYNKPDKWFKIWFYLINEVNHKDNKLFPRGSCFMKYDWIIKNHTYKVRARELLEKFEEFKLGIKKPMKIMGFALKHKIERREGEVVIE